ncbi:hypothetical protein E3226_001310 [Legionella geestiana]|uniref:hypothetical protein n=1 Tax=Legionella geestiana TaxID=45065 RepID=UPI001092CC09|nr:hypothetical protein [Legionella geestiana]QDQ39139.1 hypothetical protein E3226_001310 [Legionella geestiana]
MQYDWPTREEDLCVAQEIMEEYAFMKNGGPMGLFEAVIEPMARSVNIRLAGWVSLLAEYFESQYGVEEGERITRQVITRCLVSESTVH